MITASTKLLYGATFVHEGVGKDRASRVLGVDFMSSIGKLLPASSRLTPVGKGAGDNERQSLKLHLGQI